MPDPRLSKQIEFILEVDKLKRITRQTLLVDGSRRENDAEHSWHFALMAVLLSEYAAGKGIDLLKVVKMALVHDIVEIDAGDTYIYDVAGQSTKLARERVAAGRLFGMLPADQRDEYTALWEEFEAGASAEARFAGALDRLQPVLLNHAARGVVWREHGIEKGQVMQVNQQIGIGAPALWDFAAALIEDAVNKGFLPDAAATESANS